MTRIRDITRPVLVLSIGAFLVACAAKVVNLEPDAMPGRYEPESPFPESVGVERCSMSGALLREEEICSAGLAAALWDDRVFRNVNHPYEGRTEVDLILKSEIEGYWRHGGFLNFITWFPGPLLFMHNWRGTRFIYEADAKVELVDAETMQTIGTYRGSTSQQLIHRSTNPGPMFGALIVIPGVVKGATNVRPREKYRAMIYEATFRDLGQIVAAELVEERRSFYAERDESMRARCESRLDAPPAVGQRWEDFESCQSARFEASGESHLAEGTASIYSNDDRSVNVYVIDGAIVRWEARPPGE
jgi:hypothetical protein